MQNFFSSNILFLRKRMKITQAEAATCIGLKRNTYANYEIEHTEPDIATLNRIATFFGILLDDLINLDLTDDKYWEQTKKGERVKKEEKSDKKITNNPQELPSDSLVIDPGEPYNESLNNVFDLQSMEASDNILQILQPDKKRKIKPSLYFPDLESGIHIRVPVVGDNMYSTLKDGDKVVATLITDVQNIRPGFIYVLLDKNEGILCKRLYWDSEDTLELVSDNEVYSPYKRSLNNIEAIFKVREIHSKDLRPNFQDLHKEIRELRSEIAAIRRQISK